jgi:hypothetical protein
VAKGFRVDASAEVAVSGSLPVALGVAALPASMSQSRGGGGEGGGVITHNPNG